LLFGYSAAIVQLAQFLEHGVIDVLSDRVHHLKSLLAFIRTVVVIV